MSPGRTARTSLVARSTTGVLAGSASMRRTPSASAPACSLAVFVSSRALPEKSAFRATLAALWVVLNLLLLPRLWLDGSLDVAVSFLLLAPLGVGALAGNWIHHRLDEARFRRVVAVLLLGAGSTLLYTSLRA